MSTLEDMAEREAFYAGLGLASANPQYTDVTDADGYCYRLFADGRVSVTKSGKTGETYNPPRPIQDAGLCARIQEKHASYGGPVRDWIEKRKARRAERSGDPDATLRDRVLSTLGKGSELVEDYLAQGPGADEIDAAAYEEDEVPWGAIGAVAAVILVGGAVYYFATRE